MDKATTNTYERILMYMENKDSNMEFVQIFDRIFAIKKETQQIWINSSCRNQDIVSIRNKWTDEGNIFNAERAKRPRTPLDRQAFEDYVHQLITKSQENCDFCPGNYESKTAIDPFGRLEGNHCYTVSNAYKLAKWHSMVLLREHHPFNWTREMLKDAFGTMKTWFDKVQQFDTDYTYPIIFADSFPQGGASQIHPHIHMAMNDAFQYGKYRRLISSLKLYSSTFQERQYLNDLFKIHQYLDLALEYGKTKAFASICPLLRNEVVIFSHDCDEEFISVLYAVIKTYVDKLEKTSYSWAVYLPQMTQNGTESLVYARLMSRALPNASSDVSSVELFMDSNVNEDPKVTIDELRQYIKDNYH